VLLQPVDRIDVGPAKVGLTRVALTRLTVTCR
jgi:hypothetical protein